MLLFFHKSTRNILKRKDLRYMTNYARALFSCYTILTIPPQIFFAFAGIKFYFQGPYTRTVIAVFNSFYRSYSHHNFGYKKAIHNTNSTKTVGNLRYGSKQPYGSILICTLSCHLIGMIFRYCALIGISNLLILGMLLSKFPRNTVSFPGTSTIGFQSLSFDEY